MTVSNPQLSTVRTSPCHGAHVSRWQEKKDWHGGISYHCSTMPMPCCSLERSETAQILRKKATKHISGKGVHLCLCEPGARRNHAKKRTAATILSSNYFVFWFLLILRLPQSVSADDSSSAPVALPSEFPTMVTTLSAFPTTDMPTIEPTQSFLPSPVPSSSFAPSDLPSNYPSPEPTFETPIVSGASFLQRFVVENGRVFFPTELGFIESLYIGSTANFATDHSDVELKVETICNVTLQVGGPKFARRNLDKGEKWTMLRRGLQQFDYVDVAFEMTYSSVYINVTDYPISFQQYINRNNDTIVSKMQTLGLDVSHAQHAQRFVVITAEPTVAPGPVPTTMPTLEPTTSNSPSVDPSSAASFSPTTQPVSVTPLPTDTEDIISDGDGPPTETIVIVVSVVVAGSIVLVGLLIYFRKRAFERERRFQSDATQMAPEGIWNRGVQPSSYGISSPNGTPGNKTNGNVTTKLPQVVGREGMASPSESLISNQSLLSAGNSIGGDSGDEADATHGLADEFDQYKDQNLEKMRADVEGNLTGFDSMMSQALTRALIDEDDDHVDPSELLWGGSGRLAGAEIEASALGEVTDWLKRKENANVEEK